MSFWNLDQGRPSSIALLDDSAGVCSYQQLANNADALAAQLTRSTSRAIGFLLFNNSFATTSLYLAALRSRRHIPLLIQPSIARDLLVTLIDTYQPEWIAHQIGEQGFHGYEEAFTFDQLSILFRTAPHAQFAPHDELALLLSTSGSTGSQKLVRLSYDAISANAKSIASYLALTNEDRAVTTLPLAYSFGMSILNSHLEVGGSLLLTDKSMLERDFWELLARSKITSLSGVPSQFQMMRRAGLDNRGLNSLRALTQAGGHLSEGIKTEFACLCEKMNAKFYVMYGQTEAAPRISYVPPDRVQEKLGSIGIAIPGGTLRVEDGTNELIYRGPNVMLGYAQSREDLARGDDLQGVLRTGDLGREDADGYFYVTGRLNRFLKLSGARVNLDDVETTLATAFDIPIACIGVDERMTVILDTSAQVEDVEIKTLLRDRFNIFAGMVKINRQAALLYTSSGKLDYQGLTRLVATEPRE